MDALGHRVHGKHKNRVKMVNLGFRRWGFGCYGRGNFPGHDVLGLLAKMIKYEWGWVRIGSDGWVCMHKQAGKQKRGKRRHKWANRVLFFNVCTCAENAARCQRWLWCSERAKGRNKEQIRCALYDSIHLSYGETGKQRERWKHKAKPVHTNMTTQDQKCNKKGYHKISTAEAKKKQQHHKTNCHIQINTYIKPKPQKEAICDNK